MKANWYKKARDEQLDFFEGQSSVDKEREVEKKEGETKETKETKETDEKEIPSVHIVRAYKEYGAYYLILVTTKAPIRYYEYQINVPSKWLDHPNVNWDYPFRKIEKVNPNGLWHYVEDMATKVTEVDRDGKFIRDVSLDKE